jgi:hypothetical protein
MNRGGGGERQRERWPVALRLPKFSPNSYPTNIQFFFFQILKI